MENKKVRRNLSGIYLFDKFEGEEKRQPTAFEDCSKDVQDRFLESLNRDGLISMISKLSTTIVNIGDAFDIVPQ